MEIKIVDDEPCPTCGGGPEFFNRPKVQDEDGHWWWKCLNPDCTTTYYDPLTGRIE